MSRQKGFNSFAVLNGLPTIRTAVRIKPLVECTTRRRRTVPVRGQQASYSVDCVLDAATQQQSYQHLCAPLVDGLLNGDSSVVLLYGASQTGKSYTLQGSNSSDGAGLVVRAVQAVLRGLSIVPKTKYRLSCSYCGLGVGHDAQLVDILAAGPASAASLRDGSAAAAMAVLSSWTIEESADMLEVLRCRRLMQSSATGSLKPPKAMHTMLTLQLDSFDADRIIISSKYISFVELAAPEAKDPLGMGRSTESANGRSLAITYNSLSKVLLALRNSAPATAAVPGPTGAAAAALAAGSQTGLQQLQRVPWRDSALTRWLQDRLHAAKAITLVGTVSAAAEAAADTLATISWVSRFSAASRSGAGGVLVSFAWDVAADPEATGSYMRFQPEEQVVIDPETGSSRHKRARTRQKQLRSVVGDSPVRQRVDTPTAAGYFEPACSSPMVNQCSPNLPGSAAPHSAASVSNAVRTASRWQQQLLQEQQYSLESRPTDHHVQQWQQQQERLQGRPEETGCASPGSAAASVQAADNVRPASDNGRTLAEEVVLYGELMTALRRAGCGVRAETILEKLLQELGATRAALNAERGEADSLRADLAGLQDQHADCDQAKRLLQDHNRELQQQLAVVQKGLEEASADRDLFLKRLQQLEVDAEGSGKSPSRQGLLQQKAHLEQVHTLEAELNALASSNEQLRSQLDIAAEQLSRNKLAALSAADRADQLQQEVDVLRSAADIDGEIRRELEASTEQLQRACEATAHELATVTTDKVALQQQYKQSQESIDALAAELQETLAKVDEKETQVEALVEQLDAEQAENKVAAQKMSSLQAQLSALEEMTQQMQQQRQQAAEGQSMQQQTVQTLQTTLEDIQAVFAEFEHDLDTVAQRQWKQGLLNSSISHPISTSATNSSSSSGQHRLLQFSNSKGSRHGSPTQRAAADAGAATGIDLLAVCWAQKLQAVLTVLQAAAGEKARTAGELQGCMRRSELLERNVEELRKLVSTQEDLQQQLAIQLAASHKDADAAAEQHQAEQQKLQASRDEAQTAVTALAEELQECQASLKAAQASVSERDQALDVLADEFVELTAAHDNLQANKAELDAQVSALAAELEEALLQSDIRDQVLDQVWGQLKGLPQHSIAAAAQVLSSTAGPDAGSSWQAGMGATNAQQSRSAALENLLTQQTQQQKQGLRQQQRRRSILDGETVKSSAAAGLAQQAVRAARRRSSAGAMDEYQHKSHIDRSIQGDQDSVQQQYPGQTQSAGAKQQKQHAGLQLQGRYSSEQVQPLVVSAVQQLRSQVFELQQQLAEAQESKEHNSKLQQQLKELRQHYDQLVESSEQQEKDNLMLQIKCRQLGQQLRAKEIEAEQAQERCQELVASLKQVQQHLQQQQHVPPAAPNTPCLAQQQAELQLIDCRHQLADTQARLAETSAALKAEKAARVAAEDAEAGRQQLLAKLGALQEEVSGLHAQLLAEKKQVAGLREELALMTTSRDTWRDSAKKAEAAAAAAESSIEAKITDLTRARAEVHTIKQQLATVTQQLELQQLQGIVQKSSEMGGTDAVAEGLAARLAAAQVMRREAEEKAAELGQKFAAANKQLEGLLQQRGDDAEQLESKEAHPAVSKADAAAQRASAEGAAGQLADVSRQLAAVQADRDKLQQQLLGLQTQLLGHGSSPVHLQHAGMLQPQQQLLQAPPMQQLQLQQQPMPVQTWSSVDTPVSYESMMAPLANRAAAGVVDGASLQQQWQQIPQISSNNPFYQPQPNHPVAGAGSSNSNKQQSHGALQRRDTPGSYSGAVDTGSPKNSFLNGLFSGWKHKSSPGAVAQHGSSDVGASTPVAAAMGQHRLTYSSSGGGAAAGARSSGLGGVPVVSGHGAAWGSGSGEQQQVADAAGSHQVAASAESPCLY